MLKLTKIDYALDQVYVNKEEPACTLSSALYTNERTLAISENPDASFANWIQQPPIPSWTIAFSNRAFCNIAKFRDASIDQHSSSDWCLYHLKPEELQQAISDVLKADPRSSYRRNNYSDRLYYFTLDNAHVTAWFDETVTPHCAEVVRVVPKHLIKMT